MHLLFGTWFGWWFITLVLYSVPVIVYAARTQANSPWLVRDDGKILFFRKPLALRRSTLLAGSVLLLMLFPTLHQMVYPATTARRHATNPQAQAIAHGYLVISVLGLCLLVVYLSSPKEIRLDGERRRYERMEGWPWRPKSHVGPLEDFKGVCVMPRGSVLLLFRSPSRSRIGFILSGPGRKQASQALAEKVSQATGLPIVDYPKKS